MIKIGTNKVEGIDWLQDRLGPVTPRGLAEATYNSLKRKGLIEWHPRTYDLVLLEDLSTDELREHARGTMITNELRRTAIGNTQHNRHAPRHHRQSMQQLSSAIADDMVAEAAAEAEKDESEDNTDN